MQIKSLLIKAAVRCKDRTGQGYGGEQAGLPRSFIPLSVATRLRPRVPPVVVCCGGR